MDDDGWTQVSRPQQLLKQPPPRAATSSARMPHQQSSSRPGGRPSGGPAQHPRQPPGGASSKTAPREDRRPGPAPPNGGGLLPKPSRGPAQAPRGKPSEATPGKTAMAAVLPQPRETTIGASSSSSPASSSVATASSSSTPANPSSASASSSMAPRGAWGRPAPMPSTSLGGSVPGSAAGTPPGPGPVQVPAPFPSTVFSSDEESNDDGSSGDEGKGEGRGGRVLVNLADMQAKIFGGYGGMEGGGGEEAEEEESLFGAGLAKIKDHLLAAQSGATACLICLEKVRATDPVWDCKGGCHVICHLICIQAWARQSAQASAYRATTSLSSANFPGAVAAAAEAATWHCPKCRADYKATDVPQEYRCFCGQQKDPPFNAWLAPHTCGEICNRKLPARCGHQCKLLCHPGPCPPCPQMVRARCFCGRTSESRRCGHHAYACGARCANKLACGLHTCEAVCHEGDCPPCAKEGRQKCRCGRTEEVRACAHREFQCAEACGAGLPCGRHVCKRVCHAGPCGECPLSGKRFCPCGKVEYSHLPCDAPTPTCGSTCEKMLGCGKHRCTERCHMGPCLETCRIVITKQCRCGSLNKQVPCHQDLQCERKCQHTRTCGRHACKRRCCDGNCPPCSEVCDKKLSCKNHKCPALCHRGPCSPCPVTVRIPCACGSTVLTVPCGTEKDQRPPRCSQACSVPPRCCHGPNCKSHRCHYGPCPPCDLTCNQPLPCGHPCPLRCHGPRPEPRPAYLLRPSKKQRAAKPEQSEDDRLGTPCPACLVPLVRQCLGRHPGQERTMPCSEDPRFACAERCGNPLPCGNHACQLACHVVTAPRGARLADFEPRDPAANSSGKDSCGNCKLKCQKPRVPPCPHPCTRPCHPGECDACTELVKRKCHCGAHTLVFECAEVGTASGADLEALLSCQDFCHRKLPFCTHLCPATCHPGPCPAPTECKKKVTVWCACKRVKREWVCSDAQAAQRKGQPGVPAGSGTAKSASSLTLLPCDDECQRLIREREAAEAAAQERHRKAEDDAKQKLALTATSSGTRRRKSRPTSDTDGETSWWQEWVMKAGRWLLFLLVLVLVCALCYASYVGLQELSAYMNANEVARRRAMRERLERRRRSHEGL